MLAYRAYLSEHTKHQSLDLLYGIARSLSRAPDVETALVDLLERTRESFRVRTAEIILSGAGGDVPLRTALGAGGVTQTMQPVDHELATALRASLHDEQAVVVDRESAPPALAAFLAQQGTVEAAIAPVPGETRLVGVMLLGDRLGATTTFSAPELQLFETLAGHAGMSLEFDRLEQASGACGSCRARSSARRTAIHSPTSPTARCSCTASTSRLPARTGRAQCCSSTSTTSSASTNTRAMPPVTSC